MISIITDFPAPSAGADSLWFDFTSTQQVTLAWIQTLPPELKDAALYRLCKTVEAKPTLVESFTLNQVLYRTISGNSFTESAESVAVRTGCDRKTILKGLNQAVEQNILEKNERPGTSTEYSFKPVEEWLPEPVVRKTDIRTKKVVESLGIQGTEEVGNEPQLSSIQGVVHDTDYHQTDTPSIWRSTPDGRRYCQIPLIHDQEIGVEIQRQMDSEGLTAQKVVGRAIAFSKVPLMLLSMFANIGRKLAEGLSSLEFGSPELPSSDPVNVENVITNLADTMGRTTRDKNVPKLYGKGEDKIEYFRDFELFECGVNLNDENLINVAIAASSKDFEIATDCFLDWIAKQSCDEEGNILKTDRFGIVHKSSPTQKFINAINYKWKPYGYSELCAKEKLENASAYAPKQPGQQPTEQQLQKLVEAKEKGLIRDLFDSAGDGVLKVIDRLGFAMPWYEWLGLQPN
ncbi:hypothetical protein G7B40_039090 [Aetokthonos hydrillicola Thurmond2011]|uniref:Uncharacterized protein n=2 Tax=Aetokthonos TaxID=1550243 RepID=A0AAP5IF92_9CYAN|nr:hypothetical protein [Aetokthonos hydrillicola]MBW4591291.1 hypothetical protein [Aetokthonos hydrillicola CCALA 1050]MDR9900511.1 hypothetical protein [Aetokthonos hydrillicola Thurmond2011]